MEQPFKAGDRVRGKVTGREGFVHQFIGDGPWSFVNWIGATYSESLPFNQALTENLELAIPNVKEKM